MSVTLSAPSYSLSSNLVSQFGLLTFLVVLRMVLVYISLEMVCFVSWLMIIFVLLCLIGTLVPFRLF